MCGLTDRGAEAVGSIVQMLWTSEAVIPSHVLTAHILGLIFLPVVFSLDVYHVVSVPTMEVGM